MGPDDCADGFAHDGADGCEPILPAEPCPAGLMAVPGETECHPVMPCGPGRWGDIPVDATTQYVDGSYAGMDSDGSEARPWTSIGAAVSAAAPGALVAITQGSYVEDVFVTGKAVRLAGVCPDEVAVVATGQMGATCPPAAVCVISSPPGTEVRGIALTGPGRGLVVSGAEQVLVDRIWVHDTDDRGMVVQAVYGPTSLTVRGSLVEASHRNGLFLQGSEATIEASVVRGTLPRSTDQTSGRGISMELTCPDTPMGMVCDPTARASAVLRGSIIEDSHEFGLFVAGSDVEVDGSVVRNTKPRASDQGAGFGMSIQLPCVGTPTGLVCDPAARSTATVRGSLVEGSHEVGLHVSGSDATIEKTVVRATSPRASDQAHGIGINIEATCTEEPQGGVCDQAERAIASLRGSLVEDNQEFGLFVLGADATVEASVVRRTAPRASDGLFGDGVVIVSENAPATADLAAVRIEESARAGLGSFGADVALGSTRIRCAGFELLGEAHLGQGFVFEDGGDNLCGCPVADHACKAVSAGLAPPEPVEE